MEPIPNWYRWLLIVIATLIMCACRSPLQDNGRPLWPPIVTGPMVPSGNATTTPTSDMPTDLDAEDFAPSLRRRASQFRPEASVPATHKAHQQVRLTNATEFAPVIRTNERGTLQLQKIESILVAPPNMELPEAASEPPTSPAGINLRSSDVSDDLGTARAQLDRPNGDLGSPFADDAIAPPLNESAPAIDQDSAIPDSALNNSAIKDSASEYGATESIIPDDLVAGEPIINDEPSVQMDFAPSDCPVETVPECWNTLPVQRMQLPQKELAQLYPDEYICDGGDAQSSVHVRNDWSLQGLDPEDTVGHYDKVDGELVVEPSNRVCIYAPRFAAVRKVTAVHENEKHLQVQLAKRDLVAVTDESQQFADQFSQNVAAQRHLALQPASSFKSRQPGAEDIQVQALHSLDKDLSAHENLRVMKYGVHKQSEKARLADFTAKAIAWSHDKSVQVVLDEVVAQTRVTRQGIDEIFSISDRGPAKFRVIKTASVSDALPGEEVEFTLRFDNVGYQPIGNVTIVDNLTTRLEYIADSQQCSLDADFVNDENQVDSLTLRWEIRDPIAPGKGGLIRFRCRVR